LSKDRESARLTEQLLTAEQDERRRLALFLHDGPVQALAGVALMLDAVSDSIEEGKLDTAQRILGDALDRHRDAIRSLRDLSFHLEPIVLRDRGISPAMAALCEEIGLQQELQIDADVAAAEGLAQNVQVALYQIIREAVNGALQRRPPPTRISVMVVRGGDGRVRTTISDDGGEERRRSFVEMLSERARTLRGRISFDYDAGTRIVVELPATADD
jgi:two-component system NarL family sensor kinase